LQVPGLVRGKLLVWVAALAVALAALGLALALWLPGPLALAPPKGARNVSTRVTVRATLRRAPAAGDELALLLDPPAEGVLRIEGRELVFTPSAALAPDTTYTARVPALGFSWRFTTAPRRVLYLAPGAQDVWQLYLLDLDGGAPVQLTREPWGVRDYAVSPDGDTIAYAAEREDGGHDLWLSARDGAGLRLLLACPGASCREAAWRPDGQGLIYERHEGGQPALWTVTLDGEAAPLLWQGEPMAAAAPRLSADGRWLAALDAATEQMLLYDLASGEGDLIPGQTGVPAAWHPWRNALLMSHVYWLGESFGKRLLLADLEEGELRLITGEDETALPLVEDIHAAWSPDGEWIAFARRSTLRGAAAPRQIWLVDAQGGELRQLAQDARIHHGAPQWSPDGQLLLYGRYHWEQPDGPAALGVFELASGAQRLLPAAGSWPAWLP